MSELHLQLFDVGACHSGIAGSGVLPRIEGIAAIEAEAIGKRFVSAIEHVFGVWRGARHTTGREYEMAVFVRSDF